MFASLDIRYLGLTRISRVLRWTRILDFWIALIGRATVLRRPVRPIAIPRCKVTNGNAPEALISVISQPKFQQLLLKNSERFQFL